MEDQNGLKTTFGYIFPKENIGIEYQGEQHDSPVEFFGGEESFEKGKRLMP